MTLTGATRHFGQGDLAVGVLGDVVAQTVGRRGTDCQHCGDDQPAPTARLGNRRPVSTMPNIAPQPPMMTATGTAMASASGHMLVGHG